MIAWIKRKLCRTHVSEQSATDELLDTVVRLNELMYQVPPNIRIWHHPPCNDTIPRVPQQFEVLTTSDIVRRMGDRDR